MRGSSYHERDFAFGRTMLTVRTRIGMTQVGFAEALGISRKAVVDWEGGNSYPQTNHLKQIIVLAVQHQVFPPGREVEEVRAMWQSAHQRVLLDDAWLSSLLPGVEDIQIFQPAAAPPAAPAPPHQVSWNDAPAGSSFYGREREIDLLTGWIGADRCRVVTVLGLGGIGKSSLAASLMHRLADSFRLVLWRSLGSFPTYEDLLDGCLQVLVPHPAREGLLSVERRQDILLEQMHSIRVLLVLDHLEAVLEEDGKAGTMRPEFEGLGRFLTLAAGTDHQSCVLVTSREKPAVLVPMEGPQASARALRLAPLDTASCNKLLTENHLSGSPADRTRLIEAYTGNPLALKIVAQTIVDLFKGEIAPFLDQGEMIFGGVRELLDEQFSHLSSLEQSVLLWLAVMRVPATIDDLLEVLAVPIARAQLLEALDDLYRHSLIEHGYKQSSFTVQPVLTQYLTAWLVSQATAEIQAEKLDTLIRQGLELPQSREDVRQIQERTIVAPILSRLRSAASPPGLLEERLANMLRNLATWKEDQQGYGPANLLTLLRSHNGSLRSLNLSELALNFDGFRGLSEA